MDNVKGYINAIEENRIEEVRQFIENGVNLDFKDRLEHHSCILQLMMRMQLLLNFW